MSPPEGGGQERQRRERAARKLPNERDIVDPGPRIERGHLAPEGAGLGVELDEETLRRWRVDE